MREMGLPSSINAVTDGAGRDRWSRWHGSRQIWTTYAIARCQIPSLDALLSAVGLNAAA